MDLSDAVNIARTNQWSVLTTIRGSGRPQLSNPDLSLADSAPVMAGPVAVSGPN
jgi:hypothetical protein